MPRKIKPTSSGGQQPYCSYIPYNDLMAVRRLGAQAESVWLILLWQTCVRRRQAQFQVDLGVRLSAKQLAAWSGLAAPALSRTVALLIKEKRITRTEIPGLPLTGPNAKWIFTLDLEPVWYQFIYDGSRHKPPGPLRGEVAGKFPKAWHYLKDVKLSKYARIAALGTASLTVWLAICLGRSSGTESIKEDPYYHLTHGKDPFTTKRQIQSGVRSFNKYAKATKANKALD